MTFTVKAGTTPVYTATLEDEAGDPVPLASLSTLTLTLINITTQAAVNSRDRQNVLNANNVTVHATSGLLTWNIQALDLPATAETYYLAVFEWSWSGGTKKGWHDLTLRVDPVARPA